MRWIVRLAFLVLLAVVALRLHERQALLAVAEADLGADRQEIAQAEGWVDDLEARIDESVARLRELDARVSAFEALHADGIPAAEHEHYERILAQRNEVVSEHNDLIARRRSAVSEYEARVGRHNARVERANADAAGSTPWRIAAGIWASVFGAARD